MASRYVQFVATMANSNGRKTKTMKTIIAALVALASIVALSETASAGFNCRTYTYQGSTYTSCN